VYGIPGAGKTVVSTLVVDMVLNARRSPTIGTAYFYVRHDDPQSQDPSNILGSLLSQLGRQNSEAMRVVLDLYKDHTASHSLPNSADEADLVEALREISSHFEITYILIDGLDECKIEFDADRARLLKIISSFQTTIQCKSHTIIFSRNVSDIAEAMNGLTEISIAAVNADLRLYISAWLPNLNVQSSELAAEIMGVLIEKAEGM
jgi:Cdc6-like AAA superfamily ATPase